VELEGVAFDEQGAPFSVEELEWLLKSKEAEGEVSRQEVWVHLFPVQ